MSNVYPQVEEARSWAELDLGLSSSTSSVHGADGLLLTSESRMITGTGSRAGGGGCPNLCHTSLGL